MSTRAAELAELYNSLGPAVWRFALRLTTDPQEANDVLQETFLIATKDFTRVQTATSQQAWLIGIARNVARQRRRIVRPIPLTEETPAKQIADIDPRIDDLRRAIDRLPTPLKETLRLRLADDLSYAQIAEVQNIPIGTVRSRLHAAVKQLRDWAARAGLGPKASPTLTESIPGAKS